MADVAVTPIVALDVGTRSAAHAVLDALGTSCRFYKIGSELFTAKGPGIVDDVLRRGNDVFLDLKFHDIPNTVRGAVRSAAALGARLVTVHAAGGRKMLNAAAEASAESASNDAGRCKVLAVTVLTSLDAPDLAESWGRSSVSVEAEVLRLAALAQETGLDGIVCGAAEASLVRAALGPHLELLVPGVRLAGAPPQDQARVATPFAAAEAGATYIVIGRTVTGAPDPRGAMTRVLTELGTDNGPAPGR